MNWDQIEGQWEQIKGQVKEQFGKLTDNDLTTIKGKRQQLVGKLQEKYGYASEQAEREVEHFMSTCECDEDGKLCDSTTSTSGSLGTSGGARSQSPKTFHH